MKVTPKTLNFLGNSYDPKAGKKQENKNNIPQNKEIVSKDGANALRASIIGSLLERQDGFYHEEDESVSKIEFSPDGQIKKATWSNKDGSISQITEYTNDEETKVTKFGKNGEPTYITELKDGKETSVTEIIKGEGRCEEYTPDGQLIRTTLFDATNQIPHSVEEYENGKTAKLSKFYEDGTIRSYQEYTEGIPTITTKFDRNGEEIK